MNKKLLTAAPPPIQGGYLENSTKLQRGGKTSGLTCLDNCLSNSDVDFPLLSSQFKDLNLQLHASTKVTNPYTFSIQGNTSFSASVESAIPETTTVLYYYDWNDGYDITKDFSITVPLGVTKLFAYVEGYEGAPYSIIRNTSVNKIWTIADDPKVSIEIISPHESQKRTAWGSIVQVTPDKTYNLNADLGPEENPDISGPLEFGLFYSKSINDMTAHVVDL